MEWNWLARRALVSSEYLGVVHTIISAHDEVAYSSSSYILHLFDSTFIKNGGPFISCLDFEAREHDCTILTSGL
jgi:hypothetical protein